MSTETTAPDRVRVGFHEGNALKYVASTYSDPLDVVREALQNALDERPTRVAVHVDFKAGQIDVRDDGRGMSRAQMLQRLKSIALSSKLDDPEAIGEKGIGLLAPLAIAEECSLLSRPVGQDTGWFELSMKREDLSAEEVTFPISDHPGLSRQGGWSTLLSVRGVMKGALRKLARTEDIREHLSDAFDTVLRKSSAPTVVIRVTAQSSAGRWETIETRLEPAEFPGRREDRTVQTTYGPVEFSLYLSSEKVKKPAFRVEHKGRGSFALRDLDHYQEIADVFDSGFIQGAVGVDFCTMRPDRHGFEWDEESEAFLDALRRTAVHLRHWLGHVQDQQREDVITEVLRDVISELEEFFRSHPERAPASLRGLISKSHTEVGGRSVGLHAIGRRRRKRSKRDVPPLGGTGAKRGEQKKRRHSVVVGAGGKKQTASDQPGLTVQYQSEIGAQWHSKLILGRITINDSHPDFAAAETRGERFLRLYVAQLVWFECSSLAVDYAEMRQRAFRQTFEDDYFPLTMAWRSR